MKRRSVQIILTEKEYSAIAKQAIKNGLTVPLYLKSMAVEDNEVTENYKKLREKVASLLSGTRFTIKALFGVEWTMTKGTKLTLGKTYYGGVTNGRITNVRAEGKDTSNVMWYVKL